MAKVEKLPKIGHNVDEQKLLDKQKTRIDKVSQLKLKRAEINAEIAEICASAEADGIPKQAFDLALRYHESSPKKREGFDLGYLMMRKAIGLPMKGTQGDLFDEFAQQAVVSEESEGDDA